LPAYEVLQDALPGLIQSLRFGQSMRWNDPSLAFSRPIRWLMALHGQSSIPFSFAGLQAGPHTRGLRFVDSGEDVPVSSPDAYFRALEAQGILLDQNVRRQRILKDVQHLAETAGGSAVSDESLLIEVTHLVETPTALLGEFDPAFLELPREVLISVMKKHQRYFPVEKDGDLLPYFITVANKPSAEGEFPKLPVITQGNADVILARFADARYFVKADQQKKLDDYLPDLELLTFQVDLGSMGDKTKRIRRLVDELASMLAVAGEDLETSRRAAELCKADLATQMVVEMTSLQGVMGYYYALASGESKAVALAIREHYLPSSAEDPAPDTLPGLVVGLADRLDTLAGLFAAGLAPTGSKDPFAQRRAALGLVGNLIHWDQDLDLRNSLDAAAQQLPIKMTPEAREDCLAFISDRLQNYLLDEGYPYDVVDAVVSAQGHNPAGASRAVKVLNDWVEKDNWELVLDSYARCVRITRDLDQRYRVDSALFVEKSEVDLGAAAAKTEAEQRTVGDLEEFFALFTPLVPLITDFFDNVLVMDEDQAVRENRLGLLQNIASLTEGTLDMTRLEGF
jgi:glycyl-tRNA synthetase